jgi:general secretion pathway protein G
VTPDVNGYTYIKGTKIPKDPWGNEYMYDPPEPGRPEARVYTYGKDGQAGGEGDDADMDNLTIREEK